MKNIEIKKQDTMIYGWGILVRKNKHWYIIICYGKKQIIIRKKINV